MKRLILMLAFTAGLSAVASGQQKKGELRIVREPAIESLQKAYLAEAKEDRKLEGYRVQIYNGQRKECQSKRAEFMREYPDITPYMLYNSPEYRVQVGDFRSRLEAERFLNSIEDDFRGGFVVKTRINFPKLDIDAKDRD